MRNRLDWLDKCSLFYLLLNLVHINFIFSDDVRLLYMSSIDFSELPRNAKLVCDNGQVYDARHRCLLDMNEYGDIKYCRDMSHLQQCGKIIDIKHLDKWHREAWKSLKTPQRKSEDWLIDWLLSNANSAILQQYHGENKLLFNDMMMMRSACASPTRWVGFL